MATNLTHSILGNDPFWGMNKELSAYLDLNEIAVLMEHVYQYSKTCEAFNKDSLAIHTIPIVYPFRKSWITDRIARISRNTVHKMENHLIELGILRSMGRNKESGRVGMFTINIGVLHSCVHTPWVFFVKENRLSLLDSDIITHLQNTGRLSTHAQPQCIPMHSHSASFNNTIGTAAQMPLNNNQAELRSFNVPSGRNSSDVNSNDSILAKTPVDRSKLKNIVKVEPLSKTALKHKLLPETIELVDYWNSKGNLKQSILKYSSRGSCRYKLQAQYVQMLDDRIKAILKGSYYCDIRDMDDPKLKDRKFTVNQIKSAIDTFSRTATHEYEKRPECMQSTHLLDFFNSRNPNIIVTPPAPGKLPSRTRFKLKFPFIHYFLNCNPMSLSEINAAKCKENNPAMVNRVIKVLKVHSDYNESEKNRINISREVDKAIDKVKSIANGKSQGIIDNLPTHIIKAMGSKVHVDLMSSAVEFRLIPYLQRIREIGA